MGKKILVVDDEKRIADMIKHFLERQGYEVTVAYGACEAMEQVGDKSVFDLLITDRELGDGNGFHLARKVAGSPLQSSAERRRVIVMSADFPQNFHTQIAQLWQSGIRAIPMSKPFDLDNVHVFVACILAMP